MIVYLLPHPSEKHSVQVQKALVQQINKLKTQMKTHATQPRRPLILALFTSQSCMHGTLLESAKTTQL